MTTFHAAPLPTPPLPGRVAAGVIGALLALLIAGCATAGPSRLSQVPIEPLYVANAGDATLTRLDGGSGRIWGPPVPVGDAPAEVVAGPNGAAARLH